LKAQAASLTELTNLNEKLKAEQAASEKAAKETKPVSGQPRVKVDTSAAKDTQTSYAIGSWYGQAADREKIKMTDLGKKFDLKAFTQGFNDKVNNQLQLPVAKITKELTTLDKQQQKQLASTLSENEKQSKAILSKAAKEKGAVKTADGSIYRVIKQGEAPLVNGQSNIITELDEVLGTGKVMSSKEVRASRVQDLPPLFRLVVTKLGLGGEAKIIIPAKQAYGEQGVPGLVPPGTVSIITVKIIGIK